MKQFSQLYPGTETSLVSGPSSGTEHLFHTLSFETGISLNELTAMNDFASRDKPLSDVLSKTFRLALDVSRTGSCDYTETQHLLYTARAYWLLKKRNPQLDIFFELNKNEVEISYKTENSELAIEPYLVGPMSTYGPDEKHGSYDMHSLIREIRNATLRVLAHNSSTTEPKLALLLFDDTWPRVRTETLVPYFIEYLSHRCLLPGLYWQAIFGSCGNLVPQMPTTMGGPGIKGQLGFDGAFTSCQDDDLLGALLVHAKQDFITGLFSYKLQNSSDSENQCIRDLVDIFNDDRNSRGFELYE